MEAKELKVQVPEGYEIDAENSTFKCIKFKPIKKDITYDDVCYALNIVFRIVANGGIRDAVKDIYNKNVATNRKQLERLLALNQLLNITEYYNQECIQQDYSKYCIICENKCEYQVIYYKEMHCLLGIIALFNRKEDAQAVIDNPNFRGILDTIYKD